MMNSALFSSVLVAASVVLLGGCGTYTPNMQEFWGDNEQASVRVNDLVRLVRCETGIALQRVFRGEGAPQFAPVPGHPVPKFDLSWLDGWGIQVALTLTVVENTAINPGLSTTSILQNGIKQFPTNGNVTIPRNFILALGGTLSSTATRTDVTHIFYRVSDLRNAYFQQDEYGHYASCLPSRAGATLFTENNFKVFDALKSHLLPHDVEIANYRDSSLGQQGQNGFSHEVKFQIVSNGSVTPSWKLVDVSANSGSLPFLGTGRDRTQDIIITFGPLAEGKKGPPQLSVSAQNLQLAREIGAAVAQAIRSTP